MSAGATAPLDDAALRAAGLRELAWLAEERDDVPQVLPRPQPLQRQQQAPNTRARKGTICAACMVIRRLSSTPASVQIVN